MELFKRILAVIVIVISIIGILVCLAGLYFSWSINTPLTEAITGGLSGVERFLEAVDNGLERVNTNLAEAQTAVDTVETRVETAGDTLSETNVVYEVLDRTVGEELFPKIESARQTSEALRTSIVAFNDTLVALNNVPFVEVPTLTAELENAAARLDESRAAVQETRSELQAIKEEAVAKPVTAITSRTTRISDGLGSAQAALTQTQSNIRANLETLGNIRERVPGVIDWISIAITLVMLWLALAQASLILHAWGALKGHSPLEAIKG